MSQNPIDLDNPFGMPAPEEGSGDAFARALAYIMTLPEGRMVMHQILGNTEILNEQFSGNSHDIYDKGRRSVGLWLITELDEIDPTMYPRMLLEAAKHSLSARQAAAKETDKDKDDDDSTG